MAGSNPRQPIVIAGGGTGGHVFPGIAVARELMRRRPDRPILWIGAKAGLETRLVPAEGIPLVALGLGGIAGKSIVTRAASAARAAGGVASCLARFLTARPAAVLGVGGYASGPPGLAAVIARVPLVLHEQNAVPGGTTRSLARFARAVAVSFPETRERLTARRLEVTGNPIRAEFFEPAPPIDDRARNDACRLLVFGGSRGSRSINRAVAGALPLLAGQFGRSGTKGALSIVHQTGEADLDTVRRAHAEAGFDSDVRAFLDDLPEKMRESNLVVCRSGASTVFELAATGRASVLVPFPHAAGGHQDANATSLVENDAAVVIDDAALSGEKLAAMIRELASDPGRLARMGDAARPLARPDAAAHIADLVENAAGHAAPAPSEGEAR